MSRTLIIAVLAFGVIGISADSYSAARQGAGMVDWGYFGGSKHMDRYSPLAQINRGNVDRLQVMWTRPGYIVIPIGGNDVGTEWVALGLK